MTATITNIFNGVFFLDWRDRCVARAPARGLGKWFAMHKARILHRLSRRCGVCGPASSQMAIAAALVMDGEVVPAMDLISRRTQMAKVVLSAEPPFAELETAVKRINHIMRVKRGEGNSLAVAQYARINGSLQNLLGELRREAAKGGGSHAANR